MRSSLDPGQVAVNNPQLTGKLAVAQLITLPQES